MVYYKHEMFNAIILLIIAPLKIWVRIWHYHLHFTDKNIEINLLSDFLLR